MTSKELFYKITSNEEIDFQEYKINPEIIKNKDNILNYWWYELDKDKKKKFTILELNLIKYFIYDKKLREYKNKLKSELITSIDMDVRYFLTLPAYDRLAVKMFPNQNNFNNVHTGKVVKLPPNQNREHF